MKKIVCFLLLAALLVGCVSTASASLSAYYKDGKIYVSNSGSGITRINMNGSSKIIKNAPARILPDIIPTFVQNLIFIINPSQQNDFIINQQ